MIATSIEQSKKLIENGVKLSTADMCWRSSAYEKDESGNWYPQSSGCKTYLLVGKPNLDMDIPAWSLSALWDMLKLVNHTFEFPTSESSDELLESLVDIVSRFSRQGRL